MLFDDVKIGDFYQLKFDNGAGNKIDVIFTCEHKNIDCNSIGCRVLMANNTGAFATRDWAIGKLRILTPISIEKYVTKLNSND